MIKIDNNFSFKKSLHGYTLVETYPTTNPKTKEPTTGVRETFHANIHQLADKIIHQCGYGIEGDICDLISAWNYCTNTVADTLKKLEEVNDAPN